MTEIELKIVNAIGLEKGKVYIVEYDLNQIEETTARNIAKALGREGISGVIVRSIGGNAVRVIEVEKESTT